jgi:hypothetical protein
MSGKLKTPESAGEYKNKLEENLRGLTEPHDSINDNWNKISQGMHNVASKVLGNVAVEHHNDWND